MKFKLKYYMKLQYKIIKYFLSADDRRLIEQDNHGNGPTFYMHIKAEPIFTCHSVICKIVYCKYSLIFNDRKSGV